MKSFADHYIKGVKLNVLCCELFLISDRAGGHCHHMFALLYLLAHWSLLNLGEIPADKTCTSLPQAWSVPRGD